MSSASRLAIVGPIPITRVIGGLMIQQERNLRGEFLGAVLFTIVLPLIAAISVTVAYVNHVG